MNWFAAARNFLAQERGSGSVFLIAMLPAVLALSGLAIDGAAVFREHGKLQAVSDAAALAAAADLPDVDAAKATAVAYAQKNMPVATYGDILGEADVTAGHWDNDTRVFTPNGEPFNAVKVLAKQTAANGNAYPTTFLNLIGISTWDITTESIATSAQSNLWVALVLDNTGSMCQPDSNPCPGNTNPYTKIGALKTAAHGLLDMLKADASNPGDVMVSIVPFARDVNIGTARSTASWLSFTDFTAAPPTPSQYVGPGSYCPWRDSDVGYHCTSAPLNGSSDVSSIPSYGTYKGYICPSDTTTGHYWNGCFNSVAIGYDGSGVANRWSHTWLPNNTNSWSGCVTDRGTASGPVSDYDANNVAPTSAVANSMMVAENSPSCVQTTLLPLGYDWTALSNEVDALSASGATNQTVGFVWGWHSLTQGSPLNPPEMPDGTKRYIILLSDGLNTQDRWYGNGHDHSTQVDTRTELACANAKAQGIVIYTVFVNLNGTEGSSTVLRNCATDAAKYHELTAAGEIITTFNNIGAEMLKLRLVK